MIAVLRKRSSFFNAIDGAQHANAFQDKISTLCSA